jgi:hypothetical protein
VETTRIGPGTSHNHPGRIASGGGSEVGLWAAGNRNGRRGV